MSLSEKKKLILNFVGPIVANVTQFDDHGKVAVEAVDAFVDYLQANGVKGAYVHGTTGEGLSLQREEKLALTEKWIKKQRSLKSPFLTIINVSSTCVQESIEHARKCEEMNADGIAVLPPFYYRPNNEDDLVAYLKLIAEAAPSTPLIYYHFPEITHVEVNLTETIEKASKTIPSFAGFKYTSKNIVEVQRIHQKFSDAVKIFMGYEETLLPGLAIGVNSAISALFNLPGFAQRYTNMIEQFSTNLEAAREQHRIISEEVQKLTQKGSYFGNVKKALNEKNLGFAVGLPRPPAFS